MKVAVSTGSRLHFGLICGNHETGWEFGGLGVMVRTPGWRLEFQYSCSDGDQILATQETARRIRGFLDRIRRLQPLEPVNVVVPEEVPLHCGFGGGTQLGMAIAAGLQLLQTGQVDANPFRLSQSVDRADRSAIGTVGFARGGMLVDFGRSPTGPDRRVERIPVPDGWRFVIVCPSDLQGLHGDRERQYFDRRISMPSILVKRLSERIVQEVMPAVTQIRFHDFARALEDYGNEVGAFYAPEQGDVFAHPVIRTIAQTLRSSGVVGIAQSSWGPGISIPAETEQQAGEISRLIPRELRGTELRVNVAEPRNCGASIQILNVEEHRSAGFA